MSLFSTNMAISETKGQGWKLESYLYLMKEGQQYINLNVGCLFVQQQYGLWSNQPKLMDLNLMHS